MDGQVISMIEAHVRNLSVRLRSQESTKVSFHEALQDSLCALGRQLGYSVTTEYLLPIPNERNGRIDVAWFDGGFVKLVLEIDSSAKRKSLRKLDLARAENKVWVYCGRPFRLHSVLNEIETETRVNVINLGHVARELRDNRKRRQQAAPQPEQGTSVL